MLHYIGSAIVAVVVGFVISFEAFRHGHAQGKRAGWIEAVDQMLNSEPGSYGGSGIAGEDIKCGMRTEINPVTGHLQRSRMRMAVRPTEAQVGVCIVCGGSMAERMHGPGCPYEMARADG